MIHTRNSHWGNSFVTCNLVDSLCLLSRKLPLKFILATKSNRIFSISLKIHSAFRICLLSTFILTHSISPVPLFEEFFSGYHHQVLSSTFLKVLLTFACNIHQILSFIQDMSFYRQYSLSRIHVHSVLRVGSKFSKVKN